MEQVLLAFEATLDPANPPSVPMRPFASRGHKLPVISLGAFQFGHQASMNSKRPFLGAARSHLAVRNLATTIPLAAAAAGSAAAIGGRWFDCPGRRGRLSAISVFLFKSVLYGAFVWARRALNRQKRRFPARAVVKRDQPGRLVALAAAAAGCAAAVAAVISAEALNADIVAHVGTVVTEARDRGFLHLETARLYRESEQVVSNALTKLEADGAPFPAQGAMIFQTKIRPMADAVEFEATIGL
jgi:hypothetical protein